MDLKDLQKNWNKFGKEDPLWAIATWPEKKGNKWQLQEFFELGEKEVDGVMSHMKELGLTIIRGRALDFGCGVGRLTQALAKYFDEVVGVDIAPSMVKLANRYNRYGSRCKYYVNELEDLGVFPSNTFDFVYTNIVLQHMVPSLSKSYIREFLRVLQAQGILVFQLPSEKIEKSSHCHDQAPQMEQLQKRGVIAEIKRLVKQYLPAPLLRWYLTLRYPPKPVMEMHCVSRQEVESLLKENGAQIVEIIEDSYAGPGFHGFRYTVAKAKVS
jgi:ubiquinone/menaquinone biosynthesis C-methylase UbiE